MISEDEFMSLQEGDVVQIVSSWDDNGRCHQDNRGAMNEFLGTQQVINCHDKNHPEYVHLVGTHWFWNRYCIETVCCDDVEFYDENRCSVLSMV